MKYVSVLLATLSFSCATSRAQTTQAPDFLARPAATIRQVKPEVSQEVIEADKQAILVSYPRVIERYTGGGFSKKDAEDATIACWLDLRLGTNALPSAHPVSAAEFTRAVAKLGKLTVNSRPSNANIKVNTDEWKEKTDTSKWTPEGQKEVEVSLTGYIPHRETCLVKEMSNTVVNARLRRKFP